MSAQVFAFLRRPAEPHDWSAQELAEFYRVESALIQAGLRVVSGRGLTDEGEPWFVFCRAEDDEVVIHFARIGGRYLISAPAYCGTATGHDFRALVRDMIERHPVLRPRPKGDNLFFHPMALLVVLVTSAFLKSGRAAGAAPAKAATGEAITWKHREAKPVGETARAEARAQHEALIVLAITAIAAPVQAEAAVHMVSAAVHPADLANQRPEQPAPPRYVSVNASHSVMSSLAPPMPDPVAPIESPHSASPHMAPQLGPTPIPGAAGAIGPVQISPSAMVAVDTQAHLSISEPASGAQLLPLSALSGIPKAELDLLHALNVPNYVPYVATLPAILSIALQTGVHTGVVHSDVTDTSFPAPATPPPVAEPAAASPPVAEPAAASPPVAEPAAAPPPVAEPAAAPPPVAEPAAASPPGHHHHVTEHTAALAPASALYAGSSAPAPTVEATPSSGVPMTDMSSLLGAVEQFEIAAGAGNSALVVTSHAAIFYDVAATTANYGAVAAVTYDFGDGFSISLVGLPAELPHTGMHVQ